MEGQERSVASWRNSAIDVLDQSLSTFGEAAAAASVDFFDDVMEWSGSDVRASMPSGIYTHGELERIGRYQATKAARGDIPGFIEGVVMSVGNIVYQAGMRTMFYQGGIGMNGVDLEVETGQDAYVYGAQGYYKGDGYEVRYRRIPQGIETCDFCLMLASRGAVYLSEESAYGSSKDDVNHTHVGCDCIVVPCLVHYDGGKLIEDTYIEGYDTDTLYTMWNEWKEISSREGLSREAMDELKRENMRARLGRDVW